MGGRRHEEYATGDDVQAILSSCLLEKILMVESCARAWPPAPSREKPRHYTTGTAPYHAAVAVLRCRHHHHPPSPSMPCPPPSQPHPCRLGCACSAFTAHHRDDTSSSPTTSSSLSITCCRCEERPPTTRCLDCNDLYCHDCCHALTSDCQLRDHTLTPIKQVSPIGVRSGAAVGSHATSGNGRSAGTTATLRRCAVLERLRLGLKSAERWRGGGTKAIRARLDRACLPYRSLSRKNPSKSV
ncbi:hypothetical protein EVAR_17446_1 [Eumeta japonica]|uniref:B box-type domain-containing protein n=1 Tax=Eumeta variegata TaxID=151549 RepID=A0A4C1VCA6_EUMVA|nr:hypothetical protein EVAR_17446_1 [Eumeta japonica]